MRKGFKKALSLALTAAMTVSLASGADYSPVASAADATGDASAAASSSAITYNAIVGFQTAPDYDYRQMSTKAEDAKYNEWLAEQGKEVPNYNGYNIYMDGNAPSIRTKDAADGSYKKGDLVIADAEKATPYEGAIVSDAVMTADGEYTVSITNLNIADEPDEYFNMLYVDTDIPIFEGNTDAKATATSVKIDGQEVAANIAIPNKTDIKDRYMFMIADAYAKDTGADTTDAKFKGDDHLAPVPSESIEITFKIEGVNWKEKAPEPTEVPEQTPAPEVSMAPIQSVDLAQPFDIYISANVNKALTPAETSPKDAAGKDIQAAIFASQEIKAKVDTAKDKNGTAKFDGTKMEYVESNESSMTISKTGEYQLSVVARGDCDDLVTKNGAIWLPLLVNNVMPTTYNLLGKSVIVGEGETAKTYNWPARMFQDEADGDVRLCVCNEWAEAEPTKSLSNTITDVIPIKKGDKITFDFYVTGDAPAPIPTATPSAISTAAATSYDAYLGFQTDNWAFRNTFNDKSYGLDSKDIDYKTEVGYWDGNQTDGKPAKLKVTFADATMTDNTTYTVSVKGLNLQTLKGTKDSDVVSTAFNMLFVSTTIPLSMKNVVMKNATLKIDGNVVKEYTVVPCKGDAVDYYQFMLADGYAPSDKTPNADDIFPSGKLLNVLPTDSIEISYTMEGVDFDRHEVGYKKGKTFTNGDFKYKVTQTSIQSGAQEPAPGAVQVVGLSPKGKKKASLSLGAATPASKGSIVSYKITGVKAKAFQKSSKLKKFSFKKAKNVKTLGANAFANCKKLTSVELGKKMTKIPAGAFKGCKKLTKLTCNAKLKSVNKSAFKGCKKKIKIAGKSKAANKKKIKKVYKKVK